MSWHADPRIKVLFNEAFRQRRLFVALFIAINLIAVVVAFILPSVFTASTTILVTEKNIIQPLMQGAASTTEVADQSRMAREVMNGRKVMNQVIEAAGWVKADAPDKERKEIIEILNKRTTISNVGKNLIKIEYRDGDAERAYLTTKTLADIFIAESLGSKAAESQGAFEFIDQQTQEYHQKLTEMEEHLKEFRIANVDVRAGSEGDINQRLNALQQRIEQSQQELKEAEVRKKSLEKQLSGEAEVATTISREGQYRQRIAELTGQLETLRLSYHDTYPDIVHLRQQIEDLKQAIEQDKQRRDAAKAAGQITIDDTVINNPMYQQLKRDLSQTHITIDTLNARIGEANQQMNAMLERGKKVHGGEATLAELSRDYQVTRDIYQDLLRRRENARVSMNMDKENQGLTLKIQEPATLPLSPSGLRFVHVIIIGLLLGIAVPAGVVYSKTQIDPRLRQPDPLAERHRLPMLVVVPHLWSSDETTSVFRELEWIVLASFITVSLVGVVTALRMVGAV
jgi:polysaccharide chain length determinant protein (PEP-CTERM system associated)